jgi:hypothetical protein
MHGNIGICRGTTLIEFSSILDGDIAVSVYNKILKNKRHLF